MVLSGEGWSRASPQLAFAGAYRAKLQLRAKHAAALAARANSDPVGRLSVKRRPRLVSVMVLLLWMLIQAWCGGVSSGGGGGGGGGHQGTPPGNYKITVTGTSPGIPSHPGQSTQVTLVVD